MTQTIVAPFFRARRRRVAFSVEPRPPPQERIERPASVARALATAHHLDRGLQAGKICDQASVARVFGFTRPRLSQMLSLVTLAPDIQARVLFLEAVDGVEPLYEKELRWVAAALSWPEQRERFARLRIRTPSARG